MADETSPDPIGGGAAGRGSIVIPAAGTGVESGVESGGEETVVNYYFPVEVVAVGVLDDDEREALLEQIYRSLTEALERIA